MSERNDRREAPEQKLGAVVDPGERPARGYLGPRGFTARPGLVLSQGPATVLVTALVTPRLPPFAAC